MSGGAGDRGARPPARRRDPHRADAPDAAKAEADDGAAAEGERPRARRRDPHRADAPGAAKAEADDGAPAEGARPRPRRRDPHRADAPGAAKAEAGGGAAAESQRPRARRQDPHRADAPGAAKAEADDGAPAEGARPRARRRDPHRADAPFAAKAEAGGGAAAGGARPRARRRDPHRADAPGAPKAEADDGAAAGRARHGAPGRGGPGALTAGEAAALRAAAEAAIAWRAGIDARPIGPQADYGAALAAFGGPLPEAPGAPEAIVAALVAAAAPGLMGMPHPRFHGWVIGGSHPVGVAADWLAAAWGQNAGLAAPTPAAAAAEEVAGRWLLELLDLPRDAGFGLTTGATMANAVGLAAARNALLARAGWDVEARGLFGAPEVHVVLGAEAHSTVFMALRLLGFGAERVTRVAVDGEGRMRADALAAALAPLRGPVIVLAQAGHINSGAFDPFEAVVAAARTRDAWVHVDGAFGLWARACPELAHLAAGIEAADSWATDGHKWPQVPYDCGAVVVRDVGALRRAMSFTASYLPSGAARDPFEFTPELSRRARGFALWATLRALGRAGVAEMVARNSRVARRIAAGLARMPGIVVLNRVVLNQVAVACAAGDAATRDLLARVQAEGRCFPSGGTWKDRAIIRISVCSGTAGEADADATVAAFARARAAMREPPP